MFLKRFGQITLAALLLAALPAQATELGSGLVVEGVTPLSTAAQAGIERGDVLVRWTFQPFPATGWTIQNRYARDSH